MRTLSKLIILIDNNVYLDAEVDGGGAPQSVVSALDDLVEHAVVGLLQRHGMSLLAVLVSLVERTRSVEGMGGCTKIAKKY